MRRRQPLPRLPTATHAECQRQYHDDSRNQQDADDDHRDMLPDWSRCRRRSAFSHVSMSSV